MVEKTRVNFAIAKYLQDYVVSEADKLGIPMSTMYTIIVKKYMDDNILIENFDKATKKIPGGENK